jgi:APA family basic amino acid/polyamine antiporter
MPDRHPSGFRKNLTLFDSTAIVIGSMIGSGIFIVSTDIARQVGSPGLLMVVWLLTGVMTIIAAVSYGELAAMMPNAGGQYVYLREAYGPLSGFLYGWTLFLVIQTGTIAAVGMAFAKFFGELIPWFSEERVWLDLGLVSFNTVHVLAIGSIVFLTLINTQGIRIGKYIQNLFTITKFGILIAFILIGLIVTTDNGAVRQNLAILWDGRQITGGDVISLTGFAVVAAVGVAMVGSLFSSDAWNNITFTAGEVINPRKNIPRSLFLGTLIVTILYLMANIVYMKALPLRGAPDGATVLERGMQFAQDKRLGTAAMHMIFDREAAWIMAVCIIISTFGCNNGLILSGARVYYAMARDGVFFRKVGRLNAKGVPATGLVTQGIWASLLCLSGTYSDLLNYVVFAVLIFYALTIFGIFILRKKRPETPRPYKAFGYPVIPALYILLALSLMPVLLIYAPDYTWPGLIIVLLGIPVYYLWTRGASPGGRMRYMKGQEGEEDRKDS